MDLMSNIPEDVRTAARAYATEWYGGLEGNTASFRNMENWFFRVILSERDRCTRIVDDYASNWEIADPAIAEEIRVEVRGRIAM